MRTKPIYTLFFSFACLLFFSQKQDSLTTKYRYKPNFTVGIDVLNGAAVLFSDRKMIQGFISSEVKKDLHAVAEAGFEQNSYSKNGYDAKVSGPFVKLGGFYMLVKDPENSGNGFYAGAKLAGSLYRQQYFAVPVRGNYGNDVSVAFPASSQSSYWTEAMVGGRVQLFGSKFYIDVNMQPKYLLFTTKQDEIVPMIVPGFGKSSTKFNVGFSWNLAYSF